MDSFYIFLFVLALWRCKWVLTKYIEDLILETSATVQLLVVHYHCQNNKWNNSWEILAVDDYLRLIGIVHSLYNNFSQINPYSSLEFSGFENRVWREENCVNTNFQKWNHHLFCFLLIFPSIPYPNSRSWLLVGVHFVIMFMTHDTYSTTA